MKWSVCGAAALAALTLVALSPTSAATVTVSLIAGPTSELSGEWTAGNLLEIVVQATSDGASGQGFSGADFGSGGFGITVDGAKLKIHDVLFNGTLQVDTEASATSFNNVLGYLKADDTWVYDEFTDFIPPAPPDTRNIILTDTSMRAIASAVLGEYDLGRAAPADFLHIVLEVQAGFTPNSTAGVTFYGQMGAFGVAQADIRSNIFGTIGNDINTGTLALTNLPEPASVVLVLIGCAALSARRRGTRKA